MKSSPGVLFEENICQDICILLTDRGMIILGTEEMKKSLCKKPNGQPILNDCIAPFFLMLLSLIKSLALIVLIQMI